SPDGRFLFCHYGIGNEAHCRCWDLAGPVPAVVLDCAGRWSGFSSAGNFCATQCKDGTVRIDALTSGTMDRQIILPRRNRRLAWCDRLHQLAFCDDQYLKIVDDRTGAVALSRDLRDNTIDVLDWSPDGRTLALGTSSLRILLVDSKTGDVAQSLEGHH